VYSDLIGLAGGVRGLAMGGITSFPAIVSPLHSGINGIGTLKDLADKLVSYQNVNGSWYWHSNIPGPVASDEDTQTTAYAVLALLAADPRVTSDYSVAITNGRAWINSMQLLSGGYLSYPGGDENTEIEGEALTATADPPKPICGDGRIDAPEQCDDGNTVGGDCCSATCQNVIVCGDSVMCAPETCDDGNTVSGDGCSSTCQIEVPYCGDNLINQPSEVCDGTATPLCPSGSYCASNCLCVEGIPAVSEWGLAVLLLIGLVSGTILFGRRRVAVS
jgi:cysteine-rich repeat protein